MAQQFWELAAPKSNYGLAELDYEAMGPSTIQRCPVNPQHYRSGYPSIQVRLTRLPVTDTVWTWMSDLLIQEHVLKAFRNEGFTGYEVTSVPARLKVEIQERDCYESNPGVSEVEAALAVAPPLWQLKAIGYAGLAPPASGIRLLNSCPGCGKEDYTHFSDPSKLIDEAQWDGTDFFRVWPLARFIFVTNRVARMLRRCGFKGSRLVRVEHLEHNPLRSAGFFPNVADKPRTTC